MQGLDEASAKFEAPKARAKLFQHGGSQAVRLPRAFRFEGSEVTVRREGEAVILEPLKVSKPTSKAEWAAFWAKIDHLSGGEFPDREQPEMPDRTFDW